MSHQVQHNLKLPTLYLKHLEDFSYLSAKVLKIHVSNAALLFAGAPSFAGRGTYLATMRALSILIHLFSEHLGAQEKPHLCYAQLNVL